MVLMRRSLNQEAACRTHHERCEPPLLAELGDYPSKRLLAPLGRGAVELPCGRLHHTGRAVLGVETPPCCKKADTDLGPFSLLWGSFFKLLTTTT